MKFCAWARPVTTFPPPPVRLKKVVAISASWNFSLAVRSALRKPVSAFSHAVRFASGVELRMLLVEASTVAPIFSMALRTSDPSDEKSSPSLKLVQEKS